MGNSISNPTDYAVQVGEAPCEGASGVFRCAQYPDALVDSMPQHQWTNPFDCFLTMADDPEVRDTEFLGSRVWDSAGERSREDSVPQGQVSWLTYAQVKELALAFARGLEHAGLIKTTEFPHETYHPAQKLRMIGLVSKNRPEWFISEQAFVAANYCLVPLYDSLGEDALHQILSQTAMTTLVASRESFRVIGPMVKSLVDATGGALTSHLSHIVLFDTVEEGDRELAASINCEVVFWKDFVDEGRAHPTVPLSKQEGAHVSTICYTSGTTGDPKGVMITARNFVSILAAHQRCIMSHPGFRAGFDDVHISYLPLAHVFERMICANCIVLGVKIACYSGDTQKLLDDMKVIQPTVFLSVPRLYMRIHDRITATLKNRTVQRFIFEQAMSTKLKNLREKGVYTHPVWDPLVFKKTKALMGGRIKFMLVGGAPIEAVVQERISVIFCCPVMHGFGMTEVGPVFICNPGERVAGHIGGVQPMVEFCLKSVPEAGYYVTDSPSRGELCVRGPSVTPGYLERPDLTREVLDEQGWCSTGDIVEIMPGNAVRIIDRKKNIFKLSQGEYVAPEKLENVYSAATLVGQIMVYGDSSKNSLVAVVVPDEEEAQKWAAENVGGQQVTLETICKMDPFKAAVLRSMQEVERSSHIAGFQKARDIVLVAEPFSVENQMLTPTLKLRRAECKKRFQAEIDQLYAKMGA